MELTESEVGQGSRFTLQIDGAPFTFNASLPSPSEFEKEKRPAVSTKSLQGVRILMAEDVADNQILMRRYLESAGAHVRFASDGQEAVQMALNGDFDLVLMDIQMPILDGIQATKKLRSNGFDRPILALTAHTMAEEAAHSIDAGCDAHLTKPISKSVLIQAISGFSHRS